MNRLDVDYTFSEGYLSTEMREYIYYMQRIAGRGNYEARESFVYCISEEVFYRLMDEWNRNSPNYKYWRKIE